MFSQAKSILKPVIFDVLGSDTMLGWRLRELARSHALIVLNLHRVDDKQGSAFEAMKPALFDDLVGWLKGLFAIVTFGELETLTPGDKPPLILSFDDGYKDFIEIVVPILEKHGIHVNQNVIPTAIETGLPPMNVLLQDFIGTAPASLLREIRIPELPNCFDPDDRVSSGLLASATLKNRPIVDQEAIFAQLEQQFQRFDGFCYTPVMSVEDVKQIKGRHEIGVHSFEHASMAFETDAYLRDDAQRCIDYFQTRFGFEPAIYAFPNGSVRAGQAEILRAFGFKHVLLVNEGFSHGQCWLHQRFTMYATSRGEARFRGLGGLKKPAPLIVLH
jgi:peptidoglycan/xylan/chitin deacetylase (PgdA/CDA1 family)